MKCHAGLHVWGMAVAVSASLAACARTDLWSVGWMDDDTPATWGDFAATLDVPDCPSSNPVLTVNTTADELDGGQSITDPSQAGDSLSLVEAIWIAANRNTPHNIYFDAEVFPASTPGVIHIRDYYDMPWVAPGLCIDGRQRGVVVAYDVTVGSIDQCVGGVGCSIPLTDGALLVGLTLDNVPSPLKPLSSRVAGCRMSFDAGSLLEPRYGFAIGPGNVLSGNGRAILLWGTATDGQVQGNYVGFDPLVRELRHLGSFLFTFAPVVVRDNVFGDHGPTISFAPQLVLPVIFERNYFGIDEHGETLPAGSDGISVMSPSGKTQIGPDNVFRGLTGAAVTLWNGTTRVTRNAISANGAGITFLDGFDAVAPPTITAVTTSTVSGTCGVSGTVEVFSDPGDQGETFLGETPCDAVSPWSIAVRVPSARNVTATLTDANGGTSTFSAPLGAP